MYQALAPCCSVLSRNVLSMQRAVTQRAMPHLKVAYLLRNVPCRTLKLRISCSTASSSMASRVLGTWSLSTIWLRHGGGEASL